MSTTIIKQTPLADLHVNLGGKMIPFAGWNMPVQYTNIVKEHNAVRNKVGIFDISHMGQIFLAGEGAEHWLNGMLSNDLRSLDPGQAQYTFLLNDKGGVIDDLIVYKRAREQFFMVVNASRIEQCYNCFSTAIISGLELSNQSEHWAGMAIQGPCSAASFSQLFPDKELPERNQIKEWLQDEARFIVCRTGYTGEDGFELFCPAHLGSQWFEAFVNAGAEPCGLGARDSLRLEVCYPLNGSELSSERTPLQAGLGFFCALDKDFVGAEALRKQKEEGLVERLAAIRYCAKGPPPRAHYEVFSTTNQRLGELSSGVLSPSLKSGIALAYLPSEYSAIGTKVEIEVRGRRYPAQIVKKPFYKKP